MAAILMVVLAATEALRGLVIKEPPAAEAPAEQAEMAAPAVQKIILYLLLLMMVRLAETLPAVVTAALAGQAMPGLQRAVMGVQTGQPMALPVCQLFFLAPAAAPAARALQEATAAAPAVPAVQVQPEAVLW
jgi:hypothetical protein